LKLNPEMAEEEPIKEEVYIQDVAKYPHTAEEIDRILRDYVEGENGDDEESAHDEASSEASSDSYLELNDFANKLEGVESYSSEADEDYVPPEGLEVPYFYDPAVFNKERHVVAATSYLPLLLIPLLKPLSDLLLKSIAIDVNKLSSVIVYFFLVFCGISCIYFWFSHNKSK
jgi:hypothetical protein